MLSNDLVALEYTRNRHEALVSERRRDHLLRTLLPPQPRSMIRRMLPGPRR